MDCRKVGELIQKLRKERGWTQKYLADKMNISDRTVSKWERGLGLPDVGLLKNLSDIFGIDLGKMLDGDLNERETDGGNMKKVKFYFCPVCGNLVTAASGADVICCGRKLEPMIENETDEKHLAEVKIIDWEYYISFGHKMEKEHYINYVLCTGYDRALVVRLYPEQGGEVRIPRISGAKIYLVCSRDGLFRIM